MSAVVDENVRLGEVLKATGYVVGDTKSSEPEDSLLSLISGVRGGSAASFGGKLTVEVANSYLLKISGNFLSIIDLSKLGYPSGLGLMILRDKQWTQGVNYLGSVGASPGRPAEDGSGLAFNFPIQEGEVYSLIIQGIFNFTSPNYGTEMPSQLICTFKCPAVGESITINI